MNAASSGSGRVDDIKGHPQGEIRGLTKLVKITEHDRACGARLGGQSTRLPKGRALREINALQDVRNYAAEHGLSESEAIESGMQEKRKEFLEKGAEVYAKT